MNKDNPYQVSETAQHPSRTQSGFRLRWFLFSGAIGFVLAIVGFFYGVVMVGVPYQDPTPEVLRREAFHNSVSGWTAALGGLILLMSIIGFAAVLLYRLAKRLRKGRQ